MQPGDDTDLAVIPAAELGVWADKQELVLLPAAFRQPGHPFQWTNVLPPYREHLIEWGGQAQALPLAGDALLLVVRGDRLQDPAVQQLHRQRWGRPAAPPTTWEEFSELAQTFTAISGRPCLPDYTHEAWCDLFFRIAACYDRAALVDTDQAKAAPLHFDPVTAAPRLQAPAFLEAARLLISLVQNHCLPPHSDRPSSDIGQALARGQAWLAVVSLRDLESLPRDAQGTVDSRFWLAPLPGTRGHYTANGRFQPTVTPNYVPYYAGGWLGVVRRRCPHAPAAFDLLGELGSLDRSLEILSTPGLNAGPFRSAHLDRDRLLIWYLYRFDAQRSLQLQDALRAYVRTEIKNPAIGLRAPDQARLREAAQTQLARLRSGTSPQETLAALTAAWERIDATTPLAVRLRWRQPSAGFGN
jgi:multiple sugar transport system substrate-binding protein